MKRIKALVIAPYEGLKEVVQQVADAFTHFDIEIEIGNLEEGSDIVKAKSHSGFDVIISRGGTAAFIREVVDIPVIDIQVSGYDMLRVMTLVNGFPGKSAIVGFPNISQGASTICSLLDMKIENLTIESGEEVKATLQQLKQKEYKLVIGDVVTFNEAKEVGLTGILITSGVEAVTAAFQDAERIYHQLDQMKAELDTYKTIIDKDQRGIIVFKGEKLIQHNKMAEKIVHHFKEETKQLVKTTLTTKKEQTSILQNEETLLNVTSTPIQDSDFCVLYLEAQSKQALPEGVHWEYVSTVPAIAGTTEHVERLREQINVFSNEPFPIWLTGEKGTGKELIAKAIHKQSTVGHLPIVIMSCDAMSEKEWASVLEGNYFSNPSIGSIYVREPHKLTLDSQKKLFQRLQRRTVGPRLIISTSRMMLDLVENGQFDHDLYYFLSKVSLHLAPLRERKDDLSELVHLYLSQFHARYGKQLAGIRPEALQELSDYDWPGNIDQLIQMVEQLILHSSSYYIEMEDVRELLQPLKEQSVAKNNVNYVGTLDEIEKQIIKQVLEEEGMNQSKAAERLGINRSTLWRKLKS
ncbi:PrpR N-terminal domain-containing protein [Bacillus sp. PS06]|uniref:PrpR N-terminal domain-containing protein n=1 Tax=Bacillus sp. PS06 TaxID=2764176 RepID=UPI00177CB9B4|nr:sigma-54-dependent transcriptional regulator [Bacillus sp. PS06]MBD8071154.1 sigma-54-dependent Fis family transcriptional regulator [Bacillus sp. PS06]